MRTEVIIQQRGPAHLLSHGLGQAAGLFAVSESSCFDAFAFLCLVCAVILWILCTFLSFVYHPGNLQVRGQDEKDLQ